MLVLYRMYYACGFVINCVFDTAGSRGPAAVDRCCVQGYKSNWVRLHGLQVDKTIMSSPHWIAWLHLSSQGQLRVGLGLGLCVLCTWSTVAMCQLTVVGSKCTIQMTMETVQYK